MPNDNDRPIFEMTTIHENIHYAVFHRSSRAACDAFIEAYSVLLQQHNPDQPLSMLFDFRPDGVPSVQYIFGKLRAFYATIDEDTLPEIHAAYLHQDSSMLNFAQTFLNLLRLRARRTFLEGDKMDEAIAWLNEQAKRDQHSGSD